MKRSLKEMSNTEALVYKIQRILMRAPISYYAYRLGYNTTMGTCVVQYICM